MAEQMSGLDMFREIIGQINNLRKLVTVDGKQYKYDQKSKGYKADGKTFTPSQLKAKLKDQSYTAPRDKNIKIKKTPTTKTNTSTKTNVNKVVDKVKKVGKNLKIKNLVKGGLTNAAQAGAGVLASLAADQVVDRTFRQLAGKNKMTLEEFRAERDKKRKEKEKSILTGNKGAKRTNFRKTGAERNKIVKENAKKATLGKIITTKDYEHGRRQTSKGKTKYWNKNTNSWQTNKPGPLIKKAPNPSTPPTSTKLTRAEKLKKGMGTWRTNPEEQKKLNKGETNTQVKIKKTPPQDNKNNNNNKDAGDGASSRGSWTEEQLNKKKKKDSSKTPRINKSSKAARFARRDLRVKRITSNYLKDKKRKR